jgi:hypothetical protein
MRRRHAPSGNVHWKGRRAGVAGAVRDVQRHHWFGRRRGCAIGMIVHVHVAQCALQPALGGESRVHDLSVNWLGRQADRCRTERVTWTSRFGAITAPTGSILRAGRRREVGGEPWTAAGSTSKWVVASACALRPITRSALASTSPAGGPMVTTGSLSLSGRGDPSSSRHAPTVCDPDVHTDARCHGPLALPVASSRAQAQAGSRKAAGGGCLFLQPEPVVAGRRHHDGARTLPRRTHRRTRRW